LLLRLVREGLRWLPHLNPSWLVILDFGIMGEGEGNLLYFQLRQHVVIHLVL